MSNTNTLTTEDLKSFKTTQNNAIRLIKHYSQKYVSKVHYYELGASCVMSATQTINSIISSAAYLKGSFLMPDTVHVEKVVDWFLENKNYECDQEVLTYYMAHYLKRKTNQLYRNINKDATETSILVFGDDKAFKRLEIEMEKRRNQGVKILRN